MEILQEYDMLSQRLPKLNYEIEKTQSIKNRIVELKNNIDLLNRMVAEIAKMKKGSIALVGQITTVSKIRIYDPKTSRDVLSNIRMSNETLDKIDEAIRKMYTKKEGSAGKIVNKQKIYE